MSKREMLLCGDERCDGCDEKASLKLRAKNLAGTSEAAALEENLAGSGGSLIYGFLSGISSTSPIHLPHRITQSPCDHDDWPA